MIMPCAHTEYAICVTHECTVCVECKAYRSLLVDSCLHHAHFCRIPMHLCEPIILFDAFCKEDVLLHVFAIPTLAMGLTRWSYILVVEMLLPLTRYVVRKAAGGDNASLGHELHGPMRIATLASVMAGKVLPRSAGCHIKPR